MFIRMFCRWLYDEKSTYKGLVECKASLQSAKEFYKECCKSVETCDGLVDSFTIIYPDPERAKESLKLYLDAKQRRKEVKKVIEAYYGLILHYEDWLSRC